MPLYGEAAYWDHRYQAEPVHFDWYLKYSQLAPILLQHVRQADKILQLGVGTSLLQAHMVQDGYQQVLSVDISSVAIQHMQEVHKHIPQLTYQVGDVRQLQFQDGSFDSIIDKGTLDSLMCNEHASDCSIHMLQECLRLLKEGGALVVVTYAEPQARVPLLQACGFSVVFYMLQKASEQLPGNNSSAQAAMNVQGPIDANQPNLQAYVHAQTTYYVYVATKAPAAAATEAAAVAATGAKAEPHAAAGAEAAQAGAGKAAPGCAAAAVPSSSSSSKDGSTCSTATAQEGLQ